MSTVVAYSSQTGFTKRYAEWIAEELGCEAVSLDDEARFDAGAFDTVVFGGWFHAASLVGGKWLKRQRAAHPETKFVAFAVGATPAAWTDMVDEGMACAFPSPEFEGMPRFYLRGGFAYERLSMPNKLAMKMFFKMQAKAAESDPRAAEMLEGMRGDGFDGTDRAAIAPVVACARELGAGFRGAGRFEG
ncbi:hypothetical protein H8S61_00070 [Eggerthella sp. NSJ-70]|uniref:Flavodoxin domain-containing protein n=1 Tax=Eggerthella hominis TaxID=2763043 RepID=A0ABR7BLV2_9ACTN|nr:flavodoxin domain-containing protein [Eggerthella hominis]MBC5582599.1 hypothetical protein [Eggerthella hominis]